MNANTTPIRLSKLSVLLVPLMSLLFLNSTYKENTPRQTQRPMTLTMTLIKEEVF